MSERPQPGNFAEAVYQQLAPLAWDDENREWALLKLTGALSQMFQQGDTLARTDDIGTVWSRLLDVNRIPCEGLPWLGQFIGVVVDTSLSCDQQRQQIRDHIGWQRGTLAVLEDAISQCLSGGKHVSIRERYPDAYSFMVVTYGDVSYVYSTYFNMIRAWPTYEDYIEGTVTYPPPTTIRYDGTAVITQTSYDFVYQFAVYQQVWDQFATYGILYQYNWVSSVIPGETEIADWRYNDLWETYANYQALMLGYDSYAAIWAKGSGSNQCVENAIKANKPAGLVYTYKIEPSQDYWDLWQENGDYRQIYNTYTTYQQIYVGFPTGIHVPFATHTYAYFVGALYSFIYANYSPYILMYGLPPGFIPPAGLPPAAWQVYSLASYTDLWNRQQLYQDVYQAYATY